MKQEHARLVAEAEATMGGKGEFNAAVAQKVAEGIASCRAAVASDATLAGLDSQFPAVIEVPAELETFIAALEPTPILHTSGDRLFFVHDEECRPEDSQRLRVIIAKDAVDSLEPVLAEGEYDDEDDAP